MRRYAVIDSAQRPHFNERLARLGIRYCSLFDRQAESSLTDIAPLLAEYANDASGSELSGEIERLGVTKPAVAARLATHCDQCVEPFPEWAVALPEDVWQTGTLWDVSSSEAVMQDITAWQQ